MQNAAVVDLMDEVPAYVLRPHSNHLMDLVSEDPRRKLIAVQEPTTGT